MIIWGHIATDNVDAFFFSRPTGSWRNISNIDGLSDAQLNSLGWYAASVVQSGDYFQDTPRFVVNGINITATVSDQSANPTTAFLSMMRRRADDLEASGNIIDAILLREKFNL